MVTFDALHTVRANLNWLTGEKNGHYIAVVKKNQPLLYARVKALPWRQVPAGSVTRDIAATELQPGDGVPNGGIVRRRRRLRLPALRDGPRPVPRATAL